MYPDSGYKRAHAQSVCTRPFSRVGRGLGTRLLPFIPHTELAIARSPSAQSRIICTRAPRLSQVSNIRRHGKGQEHLQYLFFDLLHS